MHPLIERHRDELAELCRRFGVRRLEVFGSAARGTDFDEARSDVDFLVRLPDPELLSPLDAYFDLKDALEATLGRSVDLVSIGSVRNPYVLATIERDRQLLYAA
jgi:predicted nucleotidyltransferase